MRRVHASFALALAVSSASLMLVACGKSPSGKEAPAAAAPTTAPAPAPAPAAVPLTEGSVAPDFEMAAHDGTTVKISALKGKPIVLYFYPKDETPG